MSEKTRKLVGKLISQSAEIVGDTTSAVAGAVIGGVVAGPPGVAIGAATGSVLSKSFHVLGDVAARQLSYNEGVRTGAAAAIAVAGISERINNGAVPRDDDFFKLKAGQSRSSAEQIFEGILLKAKDSYEEKKARFFGRFYENLVFDENVSPSYANWMLSIAGRLTYHQFCFLALVNQAGLFNARALRGDHSHLDPELEVLKQEEMDLHGSDIGTYGLVADGSEMGQEDFGFIDKLSVLGQCFYDSFGLSEIPTEDIDDLKILLRKIGYEY